MTQRADLPIPEWAFAWGAVAVLVLSFAALAGLWSRPKLEAPGWRSMGAPGRALASPPVEVVCGALGLVLLALTVVAGYAGPQGSQDNFAPTFVYVVFWIGLAFASLLFGDVFKALSPWRAGGRAAGRVATRLRGGRPPAHRPYPERLGRWPAAVVLLAFTWTELVGRYGDFPERIATCAVLYSLLTWCAMAVYGAETWHARGEGFGVLFGLFARVAPLEVRRGRLGLRPPLGGLPGLDAVPGTVAVVVAMIGTVTFDGLSQGALWQDAVHPPLRGAFTGAGLGDAAATTLADTVGLLLGPLAVGAFYLLGVAATRRVGEGTDAVLLRRAFVHTLVPIALVYAMAHYLTQLVFQGQAMTYLASDPLGRGWDLFGTAASGIDYSVLAQGAVWYLQVGFVVAGHLCALVLAHDRALALFGDPSRAMRSQVPMLAVMVGFTMLALWLLASLNA